MYLHIIYYILLYYIAITLYYVYSIVINIQYTIYQYKIFLAFTSIQ